MASKLHYIPVNNFSNTINESISKSDEVTLAVSFVFKAGLNLIWDSLLNFPNKKRITILTSNYLKSTEPEALQKLIILKELGAKIYLFDSISSSQSFHMKGYLFESANTNILFIGSSNLSYSAFEKSHELNLATDDPEDIANYKNIITGLISHESCFELTQDIIDAYSEAYSDNENFILMHEDKPISSNNIQPNIVQADCLEILKSEREMGLTKGMVVLATGLGKTFLAALDVLQFNAKTVLFVAHRDEILKQSAASFQRVMPNKTCGFYQSSNKNKDADFIFASIQTLGRSQNLNDFDRDHFDYIVIDEFHHVGAKSYKNLVEYFMPDFFLGLTATPNRSDNIDILQYCGNNEIYKKDLIDGINLDLLCNFEYYGINDKYIDYSRITWKGSKFDTEELDHELIQNNRIEYVYENWLQHKQKRSLGFCSSIKHCELMTDYFNDKGHKAVAVHSQSKFNRKEAIQLIKEQKIDILFSVDLFNEGVDIPEIDTLLMARPTESKIIFIQQLGRGLRVSKDEKDIVKVIDFIGNHKSFLDKPAALFGFEPNQTNVKKFLKDLQGNKLDLPNKTRILYDTESIAFMEQLSETKVDLDAFYKDFKEDRGYRPTASEFYQFIGKPSALRGRYGSWFDFIDHMGDFSQNDQECFQTYKGFFKNLEKTNMTLSYKMVTLQVLLNNEFKPMRIDDLSEQSFQYLKKSRGLWNEVKSEYKFDLLDNDKLPLWKKYWLSNPIKALTETDPYFILQDDMLIPKFDLKDKHLDSFIKLSQELIDFRFASYIVRGNNEYIVQGDPSLPIDKQLFKSFDKKDTPNLLGWKKFDQMTGYWSRGGNKNYAIYVTLIKSGLQIEHRYHDYFINEDTFHWQSKKSTTQETPEAVDLIRHHKKGIKIHLFVRKTNSMRIGNKSVTPPFTYCGVVNDILKVNGNNPIQVEFTIKEKLPKNIKEEFLRI